MLYVKGHLSASTLCLHSFVSLSCTYHRLMSADMEMHLLSRLKSCSALLISV